jgi:hypothetical protein
MFTMYRNYRVHIPDVPDPSTRAVPLSFPPDAITGAIILFLEMSRIQAEERVWRAATAEQEGIESG